MKTRYSDYIIKKISTITGLLFVISAIVMGVIFLGRIDFNVQLQTYFNLDYVMQYTPLIISLMLLISGYMLARRKQSANFYLALFGADTLEEILFDWFGLINSSLGPNTKILLFTLALIALLIAYSNVFSLKPLSLKEIVMSVLFGALVGLLPYII